MLISNNCPEWASNITTDGLISSKSSNLEQTNQVVAGDTAFYIFTSGTTGVPKAALFPNVKSSCRIYKHNYGRIQTDK